MVNNNTPKSELPIIQETSNAKRLSDVFEMARFPLILLVLFIHTLPFEYIEIEPIFTLQNAYIFFTEMISHNLGKIAVPCFFIISGFYFFLKLDTAPTINWYARQWKKRCYSLCIPFIIWNTILIAAIILKNKLFIQIGLDSDDLLEQVSASKWWSLFWVTPINFPLWYIRDLICMNLLAPFFYILFRYTKWIGILAIAGVYFSTYDINIPGISMTAIFYFGIGAYLGIYKMNLLELTHNTKIYSYTIATILLLTATILNGKQTHEFAIRLFIPFGIIAFFNTLNALAKRSDIKNKLHQMALPVFWIYTTHEIYIINWVKGFWHKIGLGASPIWSFIEYLTIPAITLLCCIGSYAIAKWLFPIILAFTTGNRSKQRII